MTRAIAIIATLDTKGDQVEYLRLLIGDRGHEAIVIDVGILGEPSFEPTIRREQVAKAAGATLEELIAFNWELPAMEKMTEGACKVVKELYSNDKLNGVLAIGGSMGTSLALKVMKVIPLGIPKLILSTIAYSPTINADMICGDLMMLSWVGGLWGINSLSRRSLETAAGAITGAAEEYDKKQVTTKKLVAITGIGWSVDHYVKQLKPALEGRGYDVAMFHATGMSGRILEEAIYNGSFVAVLDLAVGGELLNQVVGTAFSPGEHRLEAAGKMGIPQIVAAGSIGVFFWGTDRPLPAKYRGRAVPQPHNYLLMQVGATTRQQAAVGKLMAEKLNLATGPTAVLISVGSFRTEFIHEGAMPIIKDTYKPRLGLKAFHKALISHLKPEVRVIEVDANPSEPKYVNTVMSVFDEMMASISKSTVV